MTLAHLQWHRFAVGGAPKAADCIRARDGY
jgi:hypothetical protein